MLWKDCDSLLEKILLPKNEMRPFNIIDSDFNVNVFGVKIYLRKIKKCWVFKKSVKNALIKLLKNLFWNRV